MWMRTRGLTVCFFMVCLLAGCKDGRSDAGTDIIEDVSAKVQETLMPKGDPSDQIQQPDKENTDAIDSEYENENAAFQEEVTEEEEPLLFQEDGREYQKVQDLISGEYLWASVVSGGKTGKDTHGHETIDHNSQSRSFVYLGTGKEIQVRRWDNLRYSAGDYLIYEYDGTMHVSKSSDIDKPVFSYDIGGTYGIINRLSHGYMTADTKSYVISFYNDDFELVKTIEGYRAMENGTSYQAGLMAIRDMQTGLMGFIDYEGNLAIPCQYGYVSDFSNGYASVLEGAKMVSYTEEGGTVAMFYGKGGRWGIIDASGAYVLEPADKYANKSASKSGNEIYYGGYRNFSPVRKDGTTDFIAQDEDSRVIETVQIR